MKRISCLTLAFAALVFCEGCRRNNEKKPPILVGGEKDFIFGKKADAFIKELKPPPKEQPEPNEQQEKLKEEKEKQERLMDTAKLGQAYVAFCAKTPAKDQSLDRFKSYVRRAGLDKIKDEMEADTYVVAFLSMPTFPGHIVVHHKIADGTMLPVYQIGPLGNDPKVAVLIKEAVVTEQVKRQEMPAMLRYVWDYSLPHYVNTPPDPAAANRMKTLLNPLNPAASLAEVQRQMPQYMKNPPGARDEKKFQKYLKENAPPAFLLANEERKLMVNLAADLRVPGQLVVCRSAAVGADKQHEAITTNGVINLYSALQISQVFQ